MSDDDECEEWVGWLDLPPKRVIRMRGTVVRVGRHCVACGHVVPERDDPPYAGHAASCPLVTEWAPEAMAREAAPLTRDEARALLDEDKRGTFKRLDAPVVVSGGSAR